MKRYLLPVIMFAGLITASAKKEIKQGNMRKESDTLRLIYPQWQGGVITSWLPDIPADDASRGYYLGAQLLKILAPQNNQKTVEVPVDTDIDSHKEECGISGYKAIVKQTKAALDILKENDPERIVTLGGECAVSVAPFTYLIDKYEDDLAIVWIDAHPDINLPYDGYTGYHAMALIACFGMGDKGIVDLLPAKTDPSKAILVGLRSWDNGMKERQQELGIKGLAPYETKENSNSLLDWIKSTGASKVAIHFDLDVIDPNDMIAGVGVESDGMRIDEVVRVINDISKEYDVVGLSIAEFMPRIAIKVQNILNRMPLLND